jgi:hypothetical protein
MSPIPDRPPWIETASLQYENLLAAMFRFDEKPRGSVKIVDGDGTSVAVGTIDSRLIRLKTEN